MNRFTNGELKERSLLLMIRLSLGQSEPSKDRKSTRLNSSHRCISYAVFCLKKKINIYPLSRVLAIESTVDIYTFNVPHCTIQREKWIKFKMQEFSADPIPIATTT